MPWAGPLPAFRAQLPGETVPDYLDARGLFHTQAAKRQKVVWMLDRWLEVR